MRNSLAPNYFHTRFCIDSAELQALKSFGDESNAQMQQFIEDLYSFKPSLPSRQEMLVIKHAYWSSFFSGKLDKPHIYIRHHVMTAQKKADLSLADLCAELSCGLDWWALCFEKAIKEKRVEKSIFVAFRKLGMMDMALFTDLYFADLISERNEIKSARAHLFERVADAFAGLAEGTADIKGASSLGAEAEFASAFKKLTDRLGETIKQAKNIAGGNYSLEPQILSVADELGGSLACMTNRLRELDSQSKISSWIKSGQAEMSAIISGDQHINSIAQKTLRFLCKRAQASLGAFYLCSDDDAQKSLRIIATFAADEQRRVGKEISFKDSIVGRAVRNKEIISLTDMEVGHLSVIIGFGRVFIKSLLLLPIMFEDEVYGVLELGSHKSFSDSQMQFIREVLHNTAALLKTTKARIKIKNLLEESKVRNLKLQIQQEKLRKINEALIAKRAQVSFAGVR